MDKYSFLKMLNEYTMDSGKVKEYLKISKQRLSDLKAAKRLIPVKGNLYWRQDVEEYAKQRKRGK